MRGIFPDLTYEIVLTDQFCAFLSSQVMSTYLAFFQHYETSEPEGVTDMLLVDDKLQGTYFS